MGDINNQEINIGRIRNALGNPDGCEVTYNGGNDTYTIKPEDGREEVRISVINNIMHNNKSIHLFQAFSFWFIECVFESKISLRYIEICHLLHFNQCIFKRNVDFIGTKFNNLVFFSESVFEKNAFFWRIAFDNNVEFLDVTFKMIADFQLTIFNKKAVFSNTIFEQEALFWRAIFNGETDFNNAQFLKNVYFSKLGLSPEEMASGAIFKQSVFFDDVIFYGNANFKHVEFHNESNFNNATFKMEAIFLNSIFTKSVYFEKTIFGNCACFSDTKFGNEIKFTGEHFNDIVDFSGAKFSGRVDFSKADFQYKTYFEATNFPDYTNFNDVKFLNEASFFKAHFRGKASFIGSSFKQKACFQGVTFHGNANFDHVEFQVEKDSQDIAYFSGVHFKERAFFTKAHFYKIANFSNVIFDHNAYFDEAEFLGEAKFKQSEFYMNAHFYGTIFKEIPQRDNITMNDIPNFLQIILNGYINLTNTKQLLLSFEQLKSIIDGNDKKEKDELANEFRNTFKNFKNGLIKDNNLIDASQFHKMELYAKELEINYKKEKAAKDWAEKFQLMFYRLTSDHHTDLLLILNNVIFLIVSFGIVIYYLFYHADYSTICTDVPYCFLKEKYLISPTLLEYICPNCTLSNIFHWEVSSIIATCFIFVVFFMLASWIFYCINAKNKYFGLCFILLYSLITFILAVKPAIMLPIFGKLIDESLKVDFPAFTSLSVVYAILMFLLIWSLQKTARKNTIVPN